MIEAVHEAGHAVVARLLAQPVKRTALAGVTTRYRRGDTKAHRQQAIIEPSIRKPSAGRQRAAWLASAICREVFVALPLA